VRKTELSRGRTAGGLKGVEWPGASAIETTPVVLVRLPRTSLPVTVTVNAPPAE
jgi:hypothetical protein